MKPDIDNYRYVCECGHQIIWITALKQNGPERIYA